MARDIAGAEQSILASLVSHRSSESKYLCSTNVYACTGVDKAELGMSLIGASRSPEAPRSLVGLTRFRLDAALSSDMKCYVSYRGPMITKALVKADSDALARQCAADLIAFKRRARGSYDVKPEAICNTREEIKLSLAELERVIQSKEPCEG